MEVAVLDNADDLCSGTDWLQHSGEINQLSVSNKLLKTQVTELERKFEDARDKLDRAEAELVENSDTIAELQMELTKAQEKLGLSKEYVELKKAYSKIDTEFRPLKITPQDQEMVTQAADLYKNYGAYMKEYEKRNGVSR